MKPRERQSKLSNAKRSNTMAGSKLTIKLTDEQQKQIKKATGKTLTELNIDLAATGSLRDEELGKVAGGQGKFIE